LIVRSYERNNQKGFCDEALFDRIPRVKSFTGIDMEKVCFKCGYKKRIDQFYRHPQMRDGHLNKCIECTKTDVKEHREVNPHNLSQYELLRKSRPERRKQKADCQRKRRRLHPEKNRAYLAVYRAVKSGRLKRQPCACGHPKTQAHHEDYSKPLEVTWECFKCHREKSHGQRVVSDFG
jgi:hypothetical protein